MKHHRKLTSALAGLFGFTIILIAWHISAPQITQAQSDLLPPANVFNLREASSISENERIAGFDVRNGIALFLVQGNRSAPSRVVAIDTAKKATVSTVALPEDHHSQLRAVDNETFLVLRSGPGRSALRRYSRRGAPAVEIAADRVVTYAVAGGQLFTLAADGTVSASDLETGAAHASTNVGLKGPLSTLLEAIDSDTVLVIERAVPSFLLVDLRTGSNKHLHFSSPALEEAAQRAQAGLALANQRFPETSKNRKIIIAVSSCAAPSLGAFVLLGESSRTEFAVLQILKDGTLGRAIRCRNPGPGSFAPLLISADANRLFVTSANGDTVVYHLN